MSKLLVVSDDDRAVDDIVALLGDDVEIVTPAQAGIERPDDDGSSFTQIAMDLADRAARASGMVTVAEAAGLVVDALDGAPGVASGQYAGPDASAEDNRALVLQQVREADTQSRSARLVSVIGVAGPGGELRTFESTLEGVIATEERGVEGVGYEPIVELDDGMTIAELLPEDRRDANPRLTALAAALPFIRELLGS